MASEVFQTPLEARGRPGRWRKGYKPVHPHRSLEYRPPDRATRCYTACDGGVCGPVPTGCRASPPLRRFRQAPTGRWSLLAALDDQLPMPSQ